jgi:hypothetical protein
LLYKDTEIEKIYIYEDKMYWHLYYIKEKTDTSIIHDMILIRKEGSNFSWNVDEKISRQKWNYNKYPWRDAPLLDEYFMKKFIDKIFHIDDPNSISINIISTDY